MSQNTPIYNTYKFLYQAVALCYAHGMRHVVLCPGSRSAPIALSFMRFEGIKHYVLVDERSAAYTALGLSRQLKQPVAIVSTSGTAALNFAPAVAEAYFSEVSLIVFTADRPAEWIGQADNQAIHQTNLYGKNVKASFSLPVETEHPDAEWFGLRQINEGLTITNSQPKGPVHFNVPLREPLYTEEVFDFSALKPRKTELVKSGKALPTDTVEMLAQYRKIMVVAGTHRPNKKLSAVLSTLASNHKIVFVPDITSNLTNISGSVSFADLVIENMDAAARAEMLPELVISFGGPLVSKSLKTFLRDKDIQAHWHLSGHPLSADTFQKMTHIFEIDSASFFEGIVEYDILKTETAYAESWASSHKNFIAKAAQTLASLPWTEVRAAYEIMNRLPQGAILHLGNSLPARFASAFPIVAVGTEIHANRGTSGIDGSVSSAAGQSMANDQMHILICGDLSFMYDSNGLWNNYLRGNLKIIIFNNHGGGIFKQLPGPSVQKELDEYFVVKQPLNFEYTALQHGCHYFYVTGQEKFDSQFDAFIKAEDRPAVMEIDFAENLSIGSVKKMIMLA